MSETKREGSSAGAIVGFQVPNAIKKRKPKVDEVLKKHTDINEGHALLYFSSLDESAGEELGKKLDSGDVDGVAEAIRTHAVRELIKKKVKEVVRKKAGGGGFVLYSPNQGKKRPAKAVGEFPTKLAAKRAELARYPPKDPSKLQRMRRDVNKLTKDPEKRAEREKQAAKQKGTDKSVAKKAHPKTESADLFQGILQRLVREALYYEDSDPHKSDWDDYISKLPKQALASDKAFQRLQKGIEKKTDEVLSSAFVAIKKSMPKGIKLKSFGVKTMNGSEQALAFSADLDGVSIEPIFIRLDNGIPNIVVPGGAKSLLTKVEPRLAKEFRGELATVQSQALDGMDEIHAAVASRDKYLAKVEDDVDAMVAELNPLKISLLKSLLTKKYRKIS